MARAGRKDRGLLSKKDSTGKAVWYVRLYHEGKERRFGSFPTKTAAREFYEKSKREQKDGRFFPERYQQGGYVLIQELLSHHAETTTVKNKATERYYYDVVDSAAQGAPAEPSDAGSHRGSATRSSRSTVRIPNCGALSQGTPPRAEHGCP